MSRINTNISSLTAIHRLSKNNSDLALRLQRLSSGLRINSGKDAPAALIASETLRGEIAGISQAIENSGRAGNVINTAEGALSEVSALLLEVQSLTDEAANSGGLSAEEVAANQLQVDSILNSINRIANTTQFNGVKLLNGSLDYTTSGVSTTNFANVRVNAARLPNMAPMNVVVQVTQSAQTAVLGTVTTGLTAAPATIQVDGNKGSEQISFAGSSSNATMAAAINAVTNATGVVAVASATGTLYLKSSDYGSDQFVNLSVVSGTFAGAGKDYGRDAAVIVNGASAQATGLAVSFRNSNLDIEFDMKAAFNTLGSSSFYVTGGGASFELGSKVTEQNKASIGMASIAAGSLGNSTDGYLSTLGSGGANNLASKNLTTAQRILDKAIKQVATLRGRLGAFQKEILESNINSLSVALENVTASESAIRDADFASETAALTRAQILVQANTSVLAQANASPQNVLALLQR